MAHLLMIESFLEGNAVILPRLLNTYEQLDAFSAYIMFLTPPRGGRLVNMEGVETLKADSNIIYSEVKNCIKLTWE